LDVQLLNSTPNSGLSCDLRRIGTHPDHWYPLAWSRELKPGKTFAAQFAGQPIVLVRPQGKPVFALEDRCAHRQVPLSKGEVAGCTIRCCYHGWAYEASGACVDVPYLGKGKLPNGVRSYPCREQDGLILIWPGDPKAAMEPGPLGAAGNSAFKTRRFGKQVHCHYTFMHENLMDMNHQFLHRRQMGQIAPRYLGRRSGDDWLEADYSFARTGGKQPLGEAAILGSRRGVSSTHRDLMTIRTEYPYQTLRIWTSGDEPVMHLWIAYTPVDAEQKVNRTFGLLSVRRPKIPGLLNLAWPALIWFTERIFAEDREIVELEQSAYDKQGADWNQEVFPIIRDLRALLAANGEAIAASTTGTATGLIRLVE
jgi:phenylpropionate dioxygenase-like ring-hydroxylating dioxygenase large terminal subunit